jgi:hypothetical protein
LEEGVVEAFRGNDHHLGVMSQGIANQIDGGALVLNHLSIRRAYEHTKSVYRGKGFRHNRPLF